MAKKIRDLGNGQELYGYDIKDVTVKDLGEYEIEIVGSTGALDRDGEVLDPSGWDLKNYRKNPVILPAHDYSAPAIGKGKKVKIEDGKMTFRVEFPQEGVNPLADIYRKLYKGGFMKASSVGFIPTDWKNGDGDKEPRRTYLKQELLELSLVSVPSNPTALSSAKGFSEAVSKGVLTNDEVELLKTELAKWGKKDDDGEEQQGDSESAAGKEEKSFKCECIKCGYKKTSEKHCKDIKCPKCGGTMRREERPGPGQESFVTDTDNGKRLVIVQEKGKEFEGQDILVMESKGVTAFYDPKEHKINSYLFDESKGWTVEDAKKFITEHQAFMQKVARPTPVKITKFDVLKNIKDNWGGFKEVVFEAIKELQTEGFYNDLLFGKVGQEDSKEPTLEKREVVDIVKETLKEL